MTITIKWASRTAALLTIVFLAACGGGGSGSGSPVAGTSGTGGSSVGNANSGSSSGGTSGGSSTGGATGGSTASSQAVQSAAVASLGGNTALEEGAGNPFIGAGQTGGTSEPIGTIFPLRQSAFGYNTTTAIPADSTNSGGATLTYLGTVKVDPFTGVPSATGTTLPNYELKIPSLGIDAMVPLLGVDYPATSNGYSITTSVQFLNYMFAGNWDAYLPGGTSYHGNFTTGFQTPVSAVPTSGQATYSAFPPAGTSNALGSIYTNANGTKGTLAGTVSGNASMTVNFSSAAVTGSITNTVANTTGFGLAWNNVGLTGTLSGATVSGTTASTSVPSAGGPATFDASSTGTFAGALYGPAGQELGVVWSLHDPTGQGKTAIGVIAAEKTN